MLCCSFKAVGWTVWIESQRHTHTYPHIHILSNLGNTEHRWLTIKIALFAVIETMTCNFRRQEFTKRRLIMKRILSSDSLTEQRTQESVSLWRQKTTKCHFTWKYWWLDRFPLVYPSLTHFNTGFNPSSIWLYPWYCGDSKTMVKIVCFDREVAQHLYSLER